jgi:hypothetical protein
MLLHRAGAERRPSGRFFHGAAFARSETADPRGGDPMQNRKRPLRVAVHQPREHHRQMLFAVLYLCGVVLLINAWLVSQQLVHF